MLRVGVGQSVHPSPEKAAREAARLAMARAGLKKSDLALLFASASYYPNYPVLINTIRDTVKASHLVGCSANGIITTDVESENESAVAVMVLASDTLTATPFLLNSLQEEAEAIGRTIGRISADHFEDPSGSSLTVVLPDSHTFHHRPFFEGIHKANERAVVVGGGASEDGSLMQTFQFHQDRILSDAVAGFVLSGPFKYTIGLTQACHPIGNPMMVTRSRHNTIHELAGRPALERYSGLFEKIPQEEIRAATGLISVGFPADPAETQFDRGSYLVRNVIGVDPREGSITLPETIEEGRVVSFLLRDPNEAIRDLETALSDLAVAWRDPPPRLALYFNCCSRGRSLYGKTGVDSSIIRKYFGDLPLIGFFTYAEIAPIHGMTQFHNYSGVLVLIGE